MTIAFARVATAITLLLIGINGGIFAIYRMAASVPPMPQIFTAEICGNPCWQGIEPGVTRTGEVEALLVSAGFEISMNDESLDGFYLSFEDTRHNPLTATYNIVRGREGIVTVVAVTEPYCALSFLMHYGTPAQVFISPTPDKHQDIVLHYPHVPITMWLDHDLRTDQINGVRATTLADTDIFSDLFQPGAHRTWSQVQPLLRSLQCKPGAG